ncbi:MAG: hypothetical protein IJ567_11205 [Lachnospiraceae bacterium]|nr:hypothetical protein [Lachnospiraceae bacterium]
MSIRPVDFNGMIQRTQDVGTIKQQEDHKPLIDQQNIQIEVEREEYRHSEQVQSKDNADGKENNLDAKNGDGSGYQGNKKKKKKSGPEGGVFRKNRSQGFDMKI